jgi:acyl dehydratase
MATEGVLTPEIQSMIGLEIGPQRYRITRKIIQKFAEVIGDPNPLWRDKQHAIKQRYDDIVSPPTLLANLFDLNQAEQARLVRCPLPNILAGGSEVEHFIPVVAKDSITVTGKLIEVQEKPGRGGKLLFLIFERICKNQRGETVARAQQTFIRY